MPIDLSWLLTIGEKVLPGLLERRPRLITFLWQAGVFRLRQGQGVFPEQVFRSHVVVLRNTGDLAAKNIHLHHRGKLAANNIHISIEPPLAYNVAPLANGAEEIVIPLIPPKFQVTISYLYPHYLTSNQISLLPIYFDDGQARQITVLSQPQRPRWLTLTLRTLIVIGIIAVLYALFELARWGMLRWPLPWP